MTTKDAASEYFEKKEISRIFEVTLKDDYYYYLLFRMLIE